MYRQEQSPPCRTKAKGIVAMRVPVADAISMVELSVQESADSSYDVVDIVESLIAENGR